MSFRRLLYIGVYYKAHLLSSRLGSCMAQPYNALLSVSESHRFCLLRLAPGSRTLPPVGNLTLPWRHRYSNVYGSII